MNYPKDMFMVDSIARIGGVFALLVLAHIIADFLLQGHSEAFCKSFRSGVRAWHCVKYSVFLLSPWFLLGVKTNYILCFAISTVSHFILDSYVPVYFWAKYIRKDPDFGGSNFSKEGNGLRFHAFLRRPLGLILSLVVDQTLHLVTLLPIAVLMVFPRLCLTVGVLSGAGILVLGLLTLLGLRELGGPLK